MKSYRAFLFNSVGHIQASHEFETEHDEAAIVIAERWREGGKMELWQLDRRVKRWD